MNKGQVRAKRVSVEHVAMGTGMIHRWGTVLGFNQDRVVLGFDEPGQLTLRTGVFDIETGKCVGCAELGHPCFDPVATTIVTPDAAALRGWRDGRVVGYHGPHRLLPCRDGVWATIGRLDRGAFSMFQGMDEAMSRRVWAAVCERVRFPDCAEAEVLRAPVGQLVHPVRDEVRDVQAPMRWIRFTRAECPDEAALVAAIVREWEGELEADLAALPNGSGLFLAPYWPTVIVPGSVDGMDRWTVRLRYAKAAWT